MAVPKKCTSMSKKHKKHTSMSKKHIRRNLWKKKGPLEAVKAFSLAKSISTGKSKSFFVRQKKVLEKS